MTANIIERSAVKQDDKWNVEALFPTMEEWEKEFKTVGRPSERPHWPEIAQYKGKLGEGVEKLKELIVTVMGIERKLSKLYTYAHLRHDEDVAEERYKKAHAQIAFLYQDFSQEVSWIEPEILALPDALLQSYLKSPVIGEYRVYLERIVRLKPHTLSADKEELLSQLGKPLSAPSAAFSAFNNADLKFPLVEDGSGKKLELSHGKFQLYLRSSDRTLRKNAFQTLHKSFDGFENTLCELLQGHVQVHNFNARARKYSSCLQAALFPNEIEPNVYRTLIETVRKNLHVLHSYMTVRRDLLKVDRLHLYDMHVPLVSEVDVSFTYKEAEERVIESVAPLGKEYQQLLKGGLEEGRWVDRYENSRKRSGAYSSGCYDSMPYILMNYQGAFHDLMTLAHEAGHSMHSLLSNRKQPYQYSSYTIFLAEIASTFNEELMFHLLYEREKDPKVRRFLINQKLDDIRATFFRQTLFAEFELKIHEMAEQNIPLTPAQLKEEYLALNRAYFGPDVEIDPEIAIEWARIPHFYSNFYVYQYATGISAAQALVEKVIKGDKGAAESYLKFLSSGSFRPPLDLLRDAGVDLRTAAPIEALIRHFESLVKELHLIG